MSRVRIAVGALVALVALTGIAACGGDDDGDGDATAGGGEARTVYVNQYSREIPYFQEILKGMEEKADEFGWQLETAFANNDPKQQTDQVKTAIVTQPDAMVIIPIDEQALVPPIQQASQTGIPVMTMGDDVGEEAVDARETFLGVDYETMGADKAEYIIEQLDGDGKVGFIHGIRGLNFTEQQDEGARSIFGENPGIEVVDGPYTGAFSSDTGLQATENLLARESDLDAIYFDNDDIALGGLQALSERGISNEDVLVVGTDGGPAALDAVEQGSLDMTLSLCGFAQGKEVMDVLRDLLDEDVAPPESIFTETELFTPDNIDEKIKKVEQGDC